MKPKSIIAAVIEAVQTQKEVFCMKDLYKDVDEIIPNVNQRSIASNFNRIRAKGLVKTIDKGKYSVVEDADFSIFKPRNAAKKIAAKQKPIKARPTKEKGGTEGEGEKPTEDPQQEKEEAAMSSIEVGSAIIDFINDLKGRVADLAEENNKLISRIKRADQIALDMVRDAKLERNTYYRPLLKDKETVIKRLNQRIEVLNTGQHLDKSRKFPLSDLSTIRTNKK